MPSPEIHKLIGAVEVRYGPIELYGSSRTEEHGTSFKLQGITATFSVLTLDGTLAPDCFDTQVEGSPAGDFVYTTENQSLDGFLEIIEQFKLPEKDWREYPKLCV